MSAATLRLLPPQHQRQVGHGTNLLHRPHRHPFVCRARGVIIADVTVMI